MSWTRLYLPEALEDLKRLDKAVRLDVLRCIERVSQNPGYPNGYGKPLGNRESGDLSGLYKIKLRKAGIRVVYKLRLEGEVMILLIVSAREDNAVYREASQRREKHQL